MIVNVKGVGRVNFPDDMSLSEINKILKETYNDEEDDDVSLEKITAIVKGLIAENTAPVEVITPAPDMEPIAAALLSVLSKPDKGVTLELPKKSSVTEIEVTARDNYGNIKRIRMTEVG